MLTGITVGRAEGVTVGEGVACGVAVGDGSGTIVGVAAGVSVGVGAGNGVSVGCGAGDVGVGVFRGAVCAHAARTAAPPMASASPRFLTLACFSKSQLLAGAGPVKLFQPAGALYPLPKSPVIPGSTVAK